ncbi:cobalamin biosynthesis protein CobG [Streptomyces durocortorensis]|uniref:Cobalamin biosynthesis protein CobG n=1 Tax=Streptomyces durocortorensis TaxID=2811104 RepID=A0ABS2I339_9ACTN|nr:cobalamin biosynthesis protein CobG [Streptomyces durocortorensis]MBM7057624.1 cobalamin biosynthesis protein CobG [Streptomyces durocortorensis]
MLAAMPDSAPSPLSAGGPALRDGGDACPGTLRLHRADDGALARVRVPGGVLSADRADALLAVAGRFGDGELHLTSRGNVQLRGLDAECGGGPAELLTAAGLLPSAAHERARNIVASPLAGLDGSPPVSGWLSALDGLVCGSAAAASLSGRFLFALDSGRGDVDALGADVTLIAAGESCFLRIGAEDEVFRIPGGEGPRAALLAAETFLRAARDAGAWRVKDLPDDVRAGVRNDVRAELARTDGAAAGPAVHRPRPRTATPPAPGPHGSPNAISVGVPLGRLTPAQWRLLTETARRYGDELRLTPWRGIVVPGPFEGEDEAAEALRTLAAAGLITAPDSPWAGVGACIGHPGCAKSLSDVRAEAGAAVGPVGRLPVYWSGCERRCGHPHGEWIDVVVTPDGHRISHVRGERRDPPKTVRDDPAALAAAVATARA